MIAEYLMLCNLYIDIGTGTFSADDESGKQNKNLRSCRCAIDPDRTIAALLMDNIKYEWSGASGAIFRSLDKRFFSEISAVPLIVCSLVTLTKPLTTFSGMILEETAPGENLRLPEIKPERKCTVVWVQLVTWGHNKNGMMVRLGSMKMIYTGKKLITTR